eukprot:TRINITY_DN2529_c2_g1_i1.p1 TRINITY_DN2529_c2_g1~~TRINITY_DN2529_c2_g1_i1.p1  ORF type:complete len:217 (+),score=47.30 TRINITY_DN2529_c2_g1_i1:69-653(+)
MCKDTHKCCREILPKDELLSRMEGKWYVVQSNLKLWQGNRKPKISYGKHRDGYVEDTVAYKSEGWCSGWVKSKIKGWDKIIKEKNGKLSLQWRGTGLLCWVTSDWKFQAIGKTNGEEWAIITFDKTAFTTAGADIFCRNKTISKESLRDIQSVIDSDKEISKYTKLNGGMFYCMHKDMTKCKLYNPESNNTPDS